MSKQQAAAKAIPKKKSAKDQIKELEEKLFGEKNKTKKKELQTLIKKLELEMELERKKKTEMETIKKNTIIKQLIPVGKDPKEVQCLNFLNGNCDKGENCQFGHEIKKKEKTEESQEPKVKTVCRFLVDAMNSGEYSRSWSCPVPNCTNLHKLTEMQNPDTELTLEEYIEMQRQNLDQNLTPVTEETFMEWKMKKLKEEEMHAKMVALLSTPKGADLFKNNPEMFEDDESAEEINYGERNYEEEVDCVQGNEQ